MGLIVGTKYLKFARRPMEKPPLAWDSLLGTKDPKFARRPMEKSLAWDSLLARKTNGETACMGLIVGTKDSKFAR